MTPGPLQQIVHSVIHFILRVGILLTRGKHLHDSIILLREGQAHITAR